MLKSLEQPLRNCGEAQFEWKAFPPAGERKDLEKILRNGGSKTEIQDATDCSVLVPVM